MTLILISGCSPGFLETSKPRDRNDLPVKITNIRGSVYIIKDYNYYENIALVYASDEGIVFFDSGWTYKSARQIVWRGSLLNKSDFIAVVPTSFLLNKTGGLSTFQATRIKILMQRNTPKLLFRYWNDEQNVMEKTFGTWRRLNYQNPDALFDREFTFFNGKIRLFYFGPGATADNVVVYFRDEKLVYAGNLLTNKPVLNKYSSIKGFYNNLEEINKLDFTHFIDGHSGILHEKKTIHLIKARLKE